MYQEVHRGLMFHRNHTNTFVVMFRLSQEMHFQTSSLLGLSPSLSYIELLILISSSIYNGD